jgi:chaperonin GroES
MIKPVRNNVLVKCFEGANATESGLFLSDAHIRDSDRVEIIAVGTGLPKKPMMLKPGQIGYRVQNWGQEIEDNGQKYYLMEQSAIIAIE